MLTRDNCIQEIFTIKNLSDFIQAEEGTWLILDLDNTLWEPLSIIEDDEQTKNTANTEEQTVLIGSDQWFGKLTQYASELMIDNLEAANTVVGIYHAVQRHIHMRAVEKETVEIINSFKTKIPVIGLTTRGKVLKDDTLRQLKEINVEFDDIVFCSGKNKGDCFRKYLLNATSMPSKVVMMDDKEHHLHHVKKVAFDFGIPFLGLRYGFLDEKIKHVDMERAHCELIYIKNRFSSHTQSLVDNISALSNHSLFQDSQQQQTKHLNQGYDLSFHK